MKEKVTVKASTLQRTMTIGAGGCCRCGGYVIETADMIVSESRMQSCFRCLICGARKYVEDLSVVEWRNAGGRGRKRGVDLDDDPREGMGGGAVLYAYTQHGKRMVRCGCNDSFNAHDDGTACFEEGPRSEPCAVCGYYPWYKIAAVAGGSRRPGDERDAVRQKEPTAGRGG